MTYGLSIKRDRSRARERWIAGDRERERESGWGIERSSRAGNGASKRQREKSPSERE